MNTPRIAITIDVEWAPLEIIQGMIQLLSDRKIPATLFCTDEPKLPLNPLHEYALHPNFLGQSDWSQKFHSLRNLYPQARGVRSHCLHSDTRLGRFLGDKKILYQSNLFIPGQAVVPFMRETGVWEIPIHYMDAVHIGTTNDYPKGFDVTSIPRFDWVVVDFHPIPWFINAASMDDYEKVKPFYKELEKLKKQRRTGNGVGSLFLSLLDEVANGRWEPFTMTQWLESFKSNSLPQA